MGRGLSINRAGLYRALDELAAFSSTGGASGITRLAWGREFAAAQTWLLEQMRSLGLHAFVDAAGNTWGRWEVGDTPAVVIGSHIDSVPSGGRYDGCLGVLAGLEVVRTLQAAGIRPRRQIWVVAWAEEEGSATGTMLMGSRLFTGLLSSDAIRAAEDSNEGTSAAMALEHAQERADADLASLPALLADVGSYLELHIEQGPILEQRHIPIGVVTHIVGVEHGTVQVRGVQNHAGGTPMADRSDALVAASILVQAVDRISREVKVRATVGSMSVGPGASNVIPGVCEFTIDARAANGESIASFVQHLRTECAVVASERNVDITYRHEDLVDPVALDTGLGEVLRSSSQSLGLPLLDVVSGAGHDAMALAQRVPAAMLFVPSTGGVSHAPAEHTDAVDCAAGAAVLADAVAALSTDG